MAEAGRNEGGHSLQPNRAALVAGLGYLLTPTPFAEFYVWPHLVVGGHVGQTLSNVAAHQTLFAAAILCYLVSYILDVVIAWALYYLLKPVSGALSLLAALFQIVYTAGGLSASLGLVTLLRLVRAPADAGVSGQDALRLQAQSLLAGFHSGWGLCLVLFGIHLMLVGYLIFRSGYMPRWLGVLVGLAGSGYAVQNVNDYLFPEPDLGFAGYLLVGELVFMIWLLVWGWRIRPASLGRVSQA